jgi:hypothetical protein
VMESRIVACIPQSVDTGIHHLLSQRRCLEPDANPILLRGKMIGLFHPEFAQRSLYSRARDLR